METIRRLEFAPAATGQPHLLKFRNRQVLDPNSPVDDKEAVTLVDLVLLHVEAKSGQRQATDRDRSAPHDDRGRRWTGCSVQDRARLTCERQVLAVDDDEATDCVYFVGNISIRGGRKAAGPDHDYVPIVGRIDRRLDAITTGVAAIRLPRVSRTDDVRVRYGGGRAREGKCRQQPRCVLRAAHAAIATRPFAPRSRFNSRRNQPRNRKISTAPLTPIPACSSQKAEGPKGS